MSTPIGDYALLSNLSCAALVSRGGAIDWFCPRRFDTPACFAALLGTPEHGQWLIAPDLAAGMNSADVEVERHYQEDTLVLETHFSTPTGKVRLLDAMPLADNECHLLRLVEGISGEVPMTMRCAPRFDYGRSTPSIATSHQKHQRIFRGESCLMRLSADHELELSGDTRPTGVYSQFTLAAGQQHWFILSDAQADKTFPAVPDIHQSLSDCAQWWHEWISRCTYQGPWKQEVKRSLITLKAMTSHPSGGMVAAVTTSLPEVPGGKANYDYRFCWIRDAAFALKVLLNAGYREEACSWRDWLLKAVDQHDWHMHTLYSVDGTVARNERVLDWLPGYMDSQPVRDGNAASQQYQLDLRGELMEVFHLARDSGLGWTDEVWELQREILEHLAQRWHQPDDGIWEFRTLHDHLTHSKVLCWAAFDRCIKDAEKFDLKAPLKLWREIREQIRADVLQRGVHPDGGYFTQRYGSDNVDASSLMFPLVGFVSADDPRMTATIAAIERELCSDGLVERYRVGDQANKEGKFLPCCFWLADNYWLAGRHQEAEALFKRLLTLANDLGLFSEEWDHRNQHMLGNFPQGLSHLAMVNTAQLLSTGGKAYAPLT